MALASDVTPPAAWRKPRSEGMLLTLPSGNRARLRRTLSLMNQISAGNFDNPLMAHVAKMLKAVSPDSNTPQEAIEKIDQSLMLDLENLSQEAQAELINLINLEVSNIFVSPRVIHPPVDYEGDPSAWEPDEEDAISSYDVDWEDKVFAYSFAQGGPAQLDRFPDAGADVDSPSDGVELGTETEPASSS